jgi:predicted enzyme related to lactoylglutathione lyase
MTFTLNHVHLKTTDPEATAKFYVENFGATIKTRPPGRGVTLDLHGLQLNVTTINKDQNHEQHLGIEHLAVNTTDFDGTLSKLKGNGVTVLEQMIGGSGNRVAFLACPDGAQVEIIETK